MKHEKRVAILAAVSVGATLLMVAAASSQGISDDVIKIGIMGDMSGPYSDNGGQGQVVSARMAIEAYGSEIGGKKIELLIADDQNKPDIGVSIAQKWIDQDHVDAILGGSASSIALAVQKMMAEKRKPFLMAGPASSQLTNEACTDMSTQWAADTYSLAKATVKSLVGKGRDTWFFITVDYTFGKQWQADATRFIEESGGKVVGASLHPLNTTDFSSYLLQAQASGAKVIALANSGADLATAIKQAQEFGVSARGQTLTPLGVVINAIDGIGLSIAKGLNVTTPFYWDASNESRIFTEAFRKRYRDRTPNENMAATYSAAFHYLKAVKAAGTDDGVAVMAKMHELPINDFVMKDVHIRADGQVMRPMFAMTVKSPEESKYVYDYYTINGIVAAEDIWRPVRESNCPLLKK
jgi:branched-chain amino acid transport system substrate-binding protein